MQTSIMETHTPGREELWEAYFVSVNAGGTLVILNNL